MTQTACEIDTLLREGGGARSLTFPCWLVDVAIAIRSNYTAKIEFKISQGWASMSACTVSTKIMYPF